MKEYRVHFTCYFEQYGNFDEVIIKVEAENQFEARRLAWEMSDKTDALKFASNIRLCGVLWDASPLNMQDYFNAEAAFENYHLRYIENVDIPNAKIKNNNETLDYCEHAKYECYGSLQAINHIAADFGRPYGMPPPSVFEELHYAKEFLFSLDGYDYEKYDAFSKKIERAEKWDSAAMYDLRDSFKYGRFSANGYEYDFSGQLGKDGIYPTRADLTDGDYKYISRWTNAWEHKSMARLPFFGEKDIIANSQTMQYDWQTLVLKKDLLQPEYQTPINSLWIANQGSAANFDQEGDRAIVAENPFTGEVVEWKRTDFLGVIRPEKIDKIDFEAIKAEYQALNAERTAENNAEHEDSDDEMEA